MIRKNKIKNINIIIKCQKRQMFSFRRILNKYGNTYNKNDCVLINSQQQQEKTEKIDLVFSNDLPQKLNPGNQEKILIRLEDLSNDFLPPKPNPIQHQEQSLKRLEDLSNNFLPSKLNSIQHQEQSLKRLEDFSLNEQNIETVSLETLPSLNSINFSQNIEDLPEIGQPHVTPIGFSFSEISEKINSNLELISEVIISQKIDTIKNDLSNQFVVMSSFVQDEINTMDLNLDLKLSEQNQNIADQLELHYESNIQKINSLEESVKNSEAQFKRAEEIRKQDLKFFKNILTNTAVIGLSSISLIYIYKYGLPFFSNNEAASVPVLHETSLKPNEVITETTSETKIFNIIVKSSKVIVKKMYNIKNDDEL